MGDFFLAPSVVIVGVVGWKGIHLRGETEEAIDAARESK